MGALAQGLVNRLTTAAEQLDEFLEGAGAGTRLGEQLGTIGSAISVPGLLIALGLLAFVFYVHDGRRHELPVFTRLLAFSGVAVLLGAVLEGYGARLVVGETWPSELLGPTFRGALLRAIAGLACILGFTRLSESTKRHRLGIAGVAVGVSSLALTGHTVSEGNPWIMISMDIVHTISAGIWVGGLVALALVFSMRRGTESPMAPTIVRFSSVATLALIAVAAAGVGMSFGIVDAPAGYVATPWGRVLLVKVGLVGVAAAIGAYNHFVVVPALDRDPGDTVYLRRARVTVTGELLILMGVLFMSILLTEAPTN